MAGPAIQSFGKYQILERIATGGTAEIYKARLEGIGGFQRTFAIKRILPNLSQNAEYIAMLVDEAKVAGLLSHANIVQILDLGQVDGIWFIAMEYVHGRDLGAVLRRMREKGLRLPMPHAVFIVIELLKGLEYAHQRQVMRGGRPVALNIVHRDVSPSNILLSYQGEVKLTDFGIARANMRAAETISGIVKGRFDYMSPEQAAGARDLDQRSDLFTVAVVLYEILTGHHPFRTTHEIETVERVRDGTYTPLRALNPDIPVALETIVDRGLRVDRDARYPSATAFKEALDRFFHESEFLLTHAALASFIKDLFPEADPLRSQRIAPLPGRQPVEPSGDAFPESPTHAMAAAPPRGQRGIVPALGLRSDEPSTLRNRPIRDEELRPETLTGEISFGWDDSSSTAEGVLLDDTSQQETLIRRSPMAVHDLDDDDDDDISGLESVTRSREGLVSVPPSADRTRSPAGGPVGRSEGPGRPTLIGWLGGVLAFCALWLGLLVGAGSATVLGWLAGVGAGAQADPVIRVVAPIGTQIRVNGDAVGQEVTVKPGVEYEVEIRLRGHAPWVKRVQLQPGEERLFTYSPVSPEPD